MLVDITIEDLGVIERSAAEFAEGLTVLTGETGAGKTMVVTGLRLLAGGRADASRVRDGAQKAAVEGRFATGRAAAAEVVESVGGVADENGEYIASRTVSAAGRSRAYLGGRAVPAATLGDFSSHVLTVHGQNDQLRLLAPEQQLAAVDRSQPSIAKVRDTYTEAFRTWRELAKDYKRRTESRRELAQEVDRLQFAINEIGEVAPEPGEDTELVTLIQRLQDVDTLREAAATALSAVDGDDSFGEAEAASALLGRASTALVGSSDKELAALGERLSDITSQVSDIAAELGTYLESLPADPNLLEESLRRQQDLKQLTRKYAADIDGVLTWRDAAAEKLDSMDTSAEVLEELKAKVMEAEKQMVAKASALTKARKKAAKNLSKQVTEEIHGLAMPNSALNVEIREAKYSKTGADEVEFQLNGKPLAGAASGGELSRVMLALEVVLADGDGATMVFDEVDAGVGGRAAVEIGRRLARLATSNQVIVVTHLPQVAAYADSHLHVSKEKFTSGVSDLSASERVEELARMLAGLDDTETGRAHAQELFDRAQAEVAAFRAPSTI
ncbi:DNA repair protein RecN [Corynebacterium simulans]|uniref:DNA repair protein RecN n=1 Tax=Corynebacterium TaxID=1716 RepID=UPI0007856AC4|nr:MULTISPECIES: DNA repair protein RecN [Corynebacterium]AMO90483.1 DNA repair protein RecN [Corynebacterium simulans]OFT48305.1 DNA repair protein RecN [Corynebacterium sp. HMSC06G04]OHO68355.1 DNA repair protein RecN [Corynebacterium sp. HMSC036D03]